MVLKVLDVFLFLRERTESAIGVKTVEVKFNGPVDTTKATVQIKKGAAIYSTDVKWNEAKDTATVSTVIALPAADYTAVVTGLTEEPLKYDFTVDAEVETTVAVSSLTLDDATPASQVAFVVSNQYGEDMKVLANDPGLTVSAFNVTKNTPVTVVEPANQYFTIDTNTNADAFKVGDEIRFTVTYKGITTQAKVLVADPSSAAAIELGDIVLGKDDTKLNVADGTVKLNYTLLDQYGKATDLSAVGATALPTTLNGVQFISSNTNVISHIAVVNDADGNGEIVLTVAGAGTAVITTVVNSSGAVAKTTITVEENSAADAVVIAAPTMLVASQDDAFNLDLTVTDQYGDLLDSVSGLAASIDLAGATVGLSDLNDKTKLNVNLTSVLDATVNATTEAKVTIVDDVDGDGVVDAGETVLGTLKFDVEPEADVQQVASASFAKVLELGASLTVDNDDLKVLDQYGREIEGTISIESSAEAVVGDGTAGAGGTDTLTAASVGASTLTVNVDGKTLAVPVKVIGSADIKNYTINSIDTLYASAGSDAYDVAVAISGVDADGKTVELAATAPDFITSSNTAVADVDATGLKVDGVSEGTATITAWKNGAVIASTTVTVSEVPSVATTVEIAADALTTDTLVDIVTVKDQYGVAIPNNGYYFVDDVAAVGTASLTAGTHTVKYVTKNGIVKTVTVTVS